MNDWNGSCHQGGWGDGINAAIVTAECLNVYGLKHPKDGKSILISSKNTGAAWRPVIGEIVRQRKEY